MRMAVALQVACSRCALAAACIAASLALTGCLSISASAEDSSSIASASVAASADSSAGSDSDSASSSSGVELPDADGWEAVPEDVSNDDDGIVLSSTSSDASDSMSDSVADSATGSASTSSALLSSSVSTVSADDASLSDDASATYRDGTYYASGTGKFGSVPVTVTIKDGKITRIDIGANQETAAMAEQAESGVVSAIIATQSTDVDTVSGATLTSNAIIEAVSEALERASS